MTKYKTYKKDLESQVSWINSVVSDQFSAFCTLCNKTFKIDNSGISLVNVHGKLNVILKLKNRESQRVFTFSSHVQKLLNNQNVLTYDEQAVQKYFKLLNV